MSGESLPVDKSAIQPELTVVIPEKIRRLIQEGATRVAREVIAQKPKLVVVLDRSMTLLWPAVEKRLPQEVQQEVAFLNIGLEKISPYDEKIGGHLFADDQEEMMRFYDWVVQQGWVERASEALHKQGWDKKRLAETRGPILIVDDLRYGGVTGKLAIFLLKQVVKEGIDVRFETILPHGKEWQDSIVKASFPDVNWENLANKEPFYTFLSEAIKGSITDPDNPLLTRKITLEEALERAWRFIFGVEEDKKRRVFEDVIPITHPYYNYYNDHQAFLSIHQIFVRELSSL